ncbi:hypothetical protein PACTADRAFT_51800 [Pachysolen tannophilus NRRL Y-2460]|uniref:Ribosomal protein S21 n=1 Tax=Pachysolen tannophilus NRRL Y-2460 TaxID=669874 RepID=A0A1E4TN74_PACTA|nr:hypothetical protein PACTADRAFT_51800 [Pachysolen tannophilus NRRL Y-2460]
MFRIRVGTIGFKSGFPLVSNAMVWRQVAARRFNSSESEIDISKLSFTNKALKQSLDNGPSSNQRPTLNHLHLDNATLRRDDIVEVGDLKNSPKMIASETPITGVLAGRTVDVRSGNVSGALASLNRLLKINNIQKTLIKQRFYMKPGKVQAQIRVDSRKRRFDKGFRRLLNVVKEAKRRGY